MTEQECVTCGRPVKDDVLPVCEEHAAAYNAAARSDAWEACATDLLPALIELSRGIGNEPLQEVLREAQARAELEAQAYRLEAERLRESLG